MSHINNEEDKKIEEIFSKLERHKLYHEGKLWNYYLK